MTIVHTYLGEERPLATYSPGYVYVLKARHGGVKIGRSVDPERRLATINRGKSIAAELVCAVFVDNCDHGEQRVHRALDAYRLSHEWYSCPVDLAVRLVRSLERAAA